MTDQTLPAAGGSYVRQKDGSLRLEEAAAPEAVVEGPVEAPVERAVKALAKPLKEV